MKKFGVYNYINNTAKSSQANLEPMSLLFNLMANQNAGVMSNPLNNNYQNQKSQTDEQVPNDAPPAPPPPQREYNPANKGYINLYPHPKI